MKENTQKLLKISNWTYALLYIPLFGYTINQDLYLLWLLLLLIGGVFALFKNRLIRPDMRLKISLIDIIVIVGLVLLIFSNVNVDVFIKQVIFFVVVISVFYNYTKALHAGRLT
ncbi:hypothetical protein LCL95_09065 [Bacillus timonensis]|nr:hypothetical protein [Bacillus timonensis]